MDTLAPAATQFKVVGTNLHTFNEWTVQDGIATRDDANKIRRGYTRLEADYKIDYTVEEQDA